MFETEVRAGIAALDQDGPPDWHERVKLDRLNMQYADVCVLGQVFGYYWLSPSTKFLAKRDPAQLGFTVPNDDWHLVDELTDTWRRELASVDAGAR